MSDPLRRHPLPPGFPPPQRVHQPVTRLSRLRTSGPFYVSVASVVFILLLFLFLFRPFSSRTIWLGEDLPISSDLVGIGMIIASWVALTTLAQIYRS